jgi:phosphatidylinositol alpha-1,6-mannosyltransferase
VNARAVVSGLRLRPDVILVLHVKLAPAAFLLGRLLGAPVVQYVHAKEMREVPGLARLAVEEAEAIVAVSSYSAELAESVGAKSERIHIIHNGVELPPRRAVSRDSTPTLISVSRLEDRYKGHDVFLDALPAIRRAVPDVHWYVVGDGTLRPELERRAETLGVAGCVTFLGAVSDAERDRHLARAWAFVMLSRQPPGRRAGEGFGIAHVEAGAHELPTLAGRVPGVTDAVQHEKTGLLVDPTNPGDVAEAAIRLLSDDGLARRLGAGGFARAKELHWPDVISRAQRVLELSTRAPTSLSRRPPGSWRWAGELVLGAMSDSRSFG